MDWSDSIAWIVLGLTGMATFGVRFFVQWRASERAGDSVVPLAFWHLSIVGSLLLLAYAIHKRDPVFILSYLPNTYIYARNLILIRRKKAAVANPAALHRDGPLDFR